MMRATRLCANAAPAHRGSSRNAHMTATTARIGARIPCLACGSPNRLMGRARSHRGSTELREVFCIPQQADVATRIYRYIIILAKGVQQVMDQTDQTEILRIG